MEALLSSVAMPEEPETETDTIKTPLTKGRKVAADVAGLLRARNALIWVTTREEARVERLLFEAAAFAGYNPHTWDCAAGVCDMAGNPEIGVGGPGPADTFDAILSRATGSRPARDVWIMRDLPAVLPLGGPPLVRMLRNLARKLPTTPRANAQAMIVLTPSAEIPPELAGHATVVEFPLPDKLEIAAILDAVLASQPAEIAKAAAPNGTRAAAIDAAVGLSGAEASACYARSLVQLGRIDPATVANEKKRVVSREGVLEWIDPLPDGLAAVGGLDLLKDWLMSRSSAWSPAARAYGLPAPKGVLMVGIPGGGKSLTAKAVPTAFGCPLLKMDLGALKGKYVGESEARFRKAIQVIESVGRCAVWIDEIEKALAGATSQSADGGVSADALGTLLTWMQDRQGESFVVATANDVSSLPPELLRKGRFDEVFAIDLPTEPERAAILKAALRQYGRGNVEVKAESIASSSEGLTGAEIASLVPSALFAAFADGAREITTGDLLRARETVVPLAQTMPEKITKLRDWIKEGRARPASSPEAIKTTMGAELDL